MFSENLLRSNQLIEQNEDVIAAVLENLQTGRLEDCAALYQVLHSSLVRLGSELDNYPPEEQLDPFEALGTFPDEVMRKDLLGGCSAPHSAPCEPVCALCEAEGVSAETCRVELRHVEASHRLTEAEAEEFASVAQLLYLRKSARAKRTYKRWSASERYSLLVCLQLYGEKTSKIARALGRSEGQVCAYLERVPREERERARRGEVPPAPSGYEPPLALDRYFVKQLKGAVKSQLAPRVAVAASQSLESRGSPSVLPALPAMPALPSLSTVLASAPSSLPMLEFEFPVLAEPKACAKKSEGTKRPRGSVVRARGEAGAPGLVNEPAIAIGVEAIDASASSRADETAARRAAKSAARLAEREQRGAERAEARRLKTLLKDATRAADRHGRATGPASVGEDELVVLDAARTGKKRVRGPAGNGTDAPPCKTSRPSLASLESSAKTQTRPRSKPKPKATGDARPLPSISSPGGAFSSLFAHSALYSSEDFLGDSMLLPHLSMAGEELSFMGVGDGLGFGARS